MKVDQDTIHAAFDQHFQRYATGSRAWDIGYHVDCWHNASQAFGQGSFDDFHRLYEELRRHWQVFRGAAGSSWTAQETFRRIKALDAACATKRLSEVRLDDTKTLWPVLEAMAGIKPTKYSPSVVAISKFLHFWNPRLFVIVDYAMMWQKVFADRRLWSEMIDVRKQVEERLPGKRTELRDETCDLISYLSILIWAGELVRSNPTIATTFAKYVQERHADMQGLPLAEYEAAAVEWFLLGLVELPPEGANTKERQ